MKKSLFFLLTVFIVFGISCANSIDGTINGTIFETKIEKKLIARMGSMGAIGNDLTLIDIEVYGIPLPQEPAEWKTNPLRAYRDVVIENPRGVSINSRIIIDAIAMTHYNTYDSKWQKRRVTKIVIK